MKRQGCLKKIKKKFTEEPILKIYQPILLMKVKTDILDFVLEVCFLQKHDGV